MPLALNQLNMRACMLMAMKILMGNTNMTITHMDSMGMVMVVVIKLILMGNINASHKMEQKEVMD